MLFSRMRADGWLTVDEAATAAGVEAAVLPRAVDHGELAAYRIGARPPASLHRGQAWREGVMLKPVEIDDGTKRAAVGRLLLRDDPAEIAADLGLPPSAAVWMTGWGEVHG